MRLGSFVCRFRERNENDAGKLENSIKLGVQMGLKAWRRSASSTIRQRPKYIVLLKLKEGNGDFF